MSRRDANLFVGRLSKTTRTRDLEDIFECYGRLARCELKYGAEMGKCYAFVDFEDRRDAEDALRNENGRDLNGSHIIVEWAKGAPRSRGDMRGPPSYSRGGPPMRGGPGGAYGSRGDDCFKCGRSGHWARNCPDEIRGAGGAGYNRMSRRSRSVSRDRNRAPRSHSRSRSRDRKHKRSQRKRSRTPSERSASKSPRSRSR